MTPAYSQSECITAIRDYYEFLTVMFIDPSFIITPPPSGWPCLNPPHLHNLRKTNAVLELMRNCLAPIPIPMKIMTTMETKKAMQAARAKALRTQMQTQTLRRTTQMGAEAMQLERRFECRLGGGVRRGAGLGPSWPVKDFFEMLKNQFRNLNFVPKNDHQIIDVWTTTHPDGDPIPSRIPELMQTVYRKHGWPDLQVYDKGLCLKEVESVLLANFPEHYRYHG